MVSGPSERPQKQTALGWYDPFDARCLTAARTRRSPPLSFREKGPLHIGGLFVRVNLPIAVLLFGVSPDEYEMGAKSYSTDKKEAHSLLIGDDLCVMVDLRYSVLLRSGYRSHRRISL
jgi:hypothetical protein